MRQQVRVKIFSDEGQAKALVTTLLNSGEVVTYFEATSAEIVKKYNGPDDRLFASDDPAFLVVAMNISQ